MRTCLCLLLGISWAFAWAQPALPEDPEAVQYLLRGKDFLEEKDYAMALLAFDAAKNRPFHQASTASIYLSGLTNYYLEEYAEAIQHFEWVLRDYPASRYAQEARYHLSLLKLQSEEERAQIEGVGELLAMQQILSLQWDADQALRRFLFYQASPDLIKTLRRRYRKAEPPVLLEAWCFSLIQAGEFLEAKGEYREYLQSGGRPLPSLQRLLEGDQMVQFVESDITKLCLFLPLYLDPAQLDTTEWRDSIIYPQVPRRSKLALEFYEGFQLALDTYLPLADKKIFLHIKDTYRDSLITNQHLSYLDSLRPDLVVGEIFNQQSRVIGEWAESTGTPQIVPLSPTPSLAEDKSYVFLAHPSAAGHGSYMATYAFEQLKLNKVAVWTDQRAQTAELAEAFSSTFDTLGGEVIPLLVDSVYSDSAREKIQDLVRSLKFQQVDGVYLPIQGNQEMAGLILSQMRIFDLKVKVMGGPHWWQQYENIDRELKESYELLFTTSYMNDKEDPVYQTFYQNYLKAYQFPPSVYGFHGYDIGMYVAQALDGFDYRSGQSLAAYLRNYPAYQGIHLSFDFRGKQQNQFVNIGKFGNERVEKVNATQRIDLKRLFPEED